MPNIETIKRLLDACSQQEQHLVFEYLRQRFPIHPIEKQLNTSAEVILEAIARASDLTLRGIRGIIAEAAFKQNVLPRLSDWRDTTPAGDNSYDFLLQKGKKHVRIQVKMQRLKSQRPMLASEGYRSLSTDKYVVETQRTRGGTDKSTNTDTRPYKFGEFDILAVSLHPSTGNWNDFLYTVADWLLPRNDNSKLLLKFQPVPKIANGEWTDDLVQCIEWLQEGRDRKISR